MYVRIDVGSSPVSRAACYTWYILRLLSAVSENITGEAKYMLF